jgi:hypothetical protein
MTQNRVLVSLLLGSTAWGAGLPAAQAATGRISLPVTGARLEGIASVSPSSIGALSLPNVGAPGFSAGFTIPHDHQPNTPLIVAVLAEISDGGCNVTMRGSALQRARAGQARDLGSPNAGFEAVMATSSFSVSSPNRQDLTFAAPAPARTAVRFQYQISPTPGEFPNLKAGDAVLFTLVRLADASTDTCTSDLRVANLSIVYTQRANGGPAKSRLSLDPFHGYSEAELSKIVWPGAEPPLRLTNSEFDNDAGFGFTIPGDHKSGTALEVEILWSSANTGCGFKLSPNSVFRSRAGRVRDHINKTASSGLTFVSASTPFQLDGDEIAVQAPAIAHRSARLTMRITGGEGFPPFQGGDSVSFSLFRRTSDVLDTCVGDVSIAGLSIVYERAAQKPTTGFVSLNPFATFVGELPVKEPSGYDGALRLPAPTANAIPDFFADFVLPNDYRADRPLILRLLVTSPSTGCHFVLFPTTLYRIRGQNPADASSNDAIRPLRASTPFTAFPGKDLRFAAPPAAGRTVSVEFEIIPTPGGFPALKAGDGVTFGLYRDGRRVADTCPGELQVAGIAAVYQTK